MSSKQKLSEEIWDKLGYVVDPEVGVPIVELNIVEKVEVADDNSVSIQLRMTTPVCPAILAYQLAADVKNAAESVDGVKKVTINVREHYMADVINQNVNNPNPDQPLQL
jgi:metal-sulfur cluster biosynthetic enzyme